MRVWWAPGRSRALVDAGHGNFYACGYEGGAVAVPPAFCSREEAETLIARGFAPVAHSPLFEGVKAVDAAKGLLRAAKAKAGDACGAHALEALYLRKSSAEEAR